MSIRRDTRFKISPSGAWRVPPSARPSIRRDVRVSYRPEKFPPVLTRYLVTSSEIEISPSDSGMDGRLFIRRPSCHRTYMHRLDVGSIGWVYCAKERNRRPAGRLAFSFSSRQLAGALVQCLPDKFPVKKVSDRYQLHQEGQQNRVRTWTASEQGHGHMYQEGEKSSLSYSLPRKHAELCAE